MDVSFASTLATGLLALGCYAVGYRRLRRRAPQHVALGQAALFAAGVAVGVLAVSPPFDSVADDLLSAHMLQHLLLGDVMPLLLVLGVRGPITMFVVPAWALRRLGRRPLVQRVASAALRPAVSFAAFAVAIGVWHLPSAYDYALAHESVHVLEHASFVAAGLLVWTQIVAPSRHARRGAGARALFAVAVLGIGMVLSEVLILTGPLYPHYRDAVDRPFGLSAAADQNRAGLLMMAEQISTLGTAAALLVWTHVEAVSPWTAATPDIPPR